MNEIKEGRKRERERERERENVLLCWSSSRKGTLLFHGARKTRMSEKAQLRNHHDDDAS